MAFSCLSFLLLLPLFFSLSSAHSITLTLSSPTNKHYSLTPNHQLGQRLSHMAAVQPSSSATAPLFPIDGAYAFPLSLGSPPQTLMFCLITSGVLTSVPCGTNFSCIDCTVDPNEIQTFKPELSNSSLPVYCNNTVLNQTLSPDLFYYCDCGSNDSCYNAPADFYVADWFEGTAGQIISESITLPGTTDQVPDIMLGCSSVSADQLQDIGHGEFGPFPLSLSSQLNLTKFSHCFVSDKYINSNVTGALVLTWEEDTSDGDDSHDIQYTSFKEIETGTWQSKFFYVALEKILVGEVEAKVAADYLAPGDTGTGGLSIEAGYTVTTMYSQVFEPLAQAFDEQVGAKYSRAMDVENQTWCRPCYNLPDSSSINDMPGLRFRFEGGAELDLPMENYMLYWNTSIVCLGVLENTGDAFDELEGPAIIMGQLQMQNLYVEYDLAKNRLGFKHKNCSEGF